MKKAKESTIVGQAIETVEGFKDVYKKLHQQVILLGQSHKLCLAGQEYIVQIEINWL